MSIIGNGSLIQIQQAHAAIKAAANMKRAATDEACHIARQKAVEREVVGRSIKLARGRPKNGAAPGPEFAAAAKRKKLYLSSTGLRAFHFAWSSVSKSSIARGAPGTRVYANAAAIHIVYIEDGAIARTGHTVYIDSSRVETRPDGEPLVLSNISDIYEERVEFFQLVDQFERVNHGDKVEIDFEVNADKWQAVVEDPNCDPAILTAYAEWAANIERPKKQPIALKGSGSNLRMLMKDHGFVFADPIVTEERLKRDGFCFHDGRGGRTEYRLVFELPREFNHQQRAEALALLCHQFEEAGCMYVAVIHAPDPHNDQDNYHIHLDFYDRKCRRLDDTADNFMNVKKQFKSIVEDEMESGKYDEQVLSRAWDFTVKRTYDSNKCTKTHYPFGATHKSAAVRDIRFVAKVRKAFAADINAVAREAGYGELYDPRSYAAMGMNCPASKKLGSAAHGLETKGVPTKIGLDNEAAQARFEMDLIASAHQERGRQLNALQYDWQKTSDDSPVKLMAQKIAVQEELARAQLASDIRRDLAFLKLERERERSRAMLVSERQSRASRAGTPEAQLRSASLAQSADQHLADLDQRESDLIIEIAPLDEFAAAHGPERVARAISEFKQEKLRHVIEHDLRGLLPGKLEGFGRRNVMSKRGTLVVEGDHTAKPVSVAGVSDIAAANQKPAIESDKSLAAASPITNATGQFHAPATRVSATHDRRAQHPLDVENHARATSVLGSGGDLQTPLADQLLTRPLDTDDGASGAVSIDEPRGADPTAQDQNPITREPPNARDSAEHIGASLFVENDEGSASVDVDELSATAENDTINNARDMDSVNAATGIVKSDTAPQPSVENGGPVETSFENRSADAVAIQPPLGTPAYLTEEEIREILRPRRVGSDGVFRVVDLPADTPTAIPAIVTRQEELDPITAAKLLWAYDDISKKAKAALPKGEKQLYLSATNNHLADELRVALSKGRQNHRAAVREAERARNVRQAKAAGIALHVNGPRDHDQHAQAARQAQISKGRV